MALTAPSAGTRAALIRSCTVGDLSARADAFTASRDSFSAKPSEIRALTHHEHPVVLTVSPASIVSLTFFILSRSSRISLLALFAPMPEDLGQRLLVLV